LALMIELFAWVDDSLNFIATIIYIVKNNSEFINSIKRESITHRAQ